ncbi:cellulase family glycosylhydrolase [Streptomyces sp. NBC_00078]|uniref:cellulase family glycosylhydrolase n=1 Tax=unclassified Streptomyces TaxID=2593676 RepID=UPI00225C1BBC|nr:cellulase family glycosylhydrolase [Streptomyces sp. NBC_00078]MCX5425932.1 cellulase family glycosylhydrolase [Streptomyces sp. NBC_00078]
MSDIQPLAHRRARGRGLGRLAALVTALAVMLSLSGAAAFGAADVHGTALHPVVRVPAKAIDAVAQMQPSWNLGNTLDAIPNETAWGNALTTKATFDTIAAAGFHSVRIPVTWKDHQSATAPYTIDATYMARVKQVVDWAQADGLYVVINIHHDSEVWVSNITTDHDNVMARFDSTWSQISEAFKSEPRTLLFESVNEPRFPDVTAAQKTQFLNELNVSFHTVVRASGGANATRMLVLPTQGGDGAQPLLDDLSTTINSLHDSQLVATVHFYSYYPFSMNLAGGTLYGDVAQKYLDDSFADMHDTFVAKGIPVYLGEYGLMTSPNYFHPETVERGEELKYYEQLGYAARKYGVTTALWDAFNYLNRETLQWRDPGLFAAIKSSWTTRSGTASFDKIFVAKSAPITAESLTLNLNGTHFLGVWQGKTRLLPGRDYTVSGTTLTFTASALTRLVGDRAYGTDATVQARFSRGVPWNIDIVTNDNPTVAAATGTTDGLTIPTQYRGNNLATMHATYADGTNAGPLDWTPYQTFNEAFSPDYPNSTIVLTPLFLASLRDGVTATLVFYFYSGQTATYKVTKNGSTVTGTVG